MVSKKSNLNFIPIAKPFFDREEERLALEVIRSGWIAQGLKVEEFENKVAEYVGAKYAVAVSSGTTALHLALLILGISQGDEVIVPSFSFIATANAIVYCGGRPVFVDIDPKTYNINPDKIEEFIHKKYKFDSNKRILFNKKSGSCVKAIMPVHQFGLPCDMDKILEIATRYNLAVIEDAACALGAEYKGKKIGSIGQISCFSFHPRKVITTGEGGMITTDNKNYVQKAIMLRNHGALISSSAHKYIKRIRSEKYLQLGYNYRMTDMQAALGIAQISKLKTIIEKRNSIAARYDSAFRNIENVIIPRIAKYSVSVYQSYILWIKNDSRINRDHLIKKLKQSNISTRPGNQAIHLEPFYLKHFGKRYLPQTVKAARQTISLPIFPHLTKVEQDYIIFKVLECLKN